MPEQARDQKADRLQEAMERLEQGVSEIFESGRYEEYLKVMGRFHRYSINNTMLIALQKPDASYVAGYRAWQDKFNRHVMKGEKGLDIIAPVKKKVLVEEPLKDSQGDIRFDRDGNPLTQQVEKTTTRFKVERVFDISQTEGDPLPTLGVDELVGDVDRFDDVMRALEKASPVPIRFEDITSGAKGYYSFAEGNKHITIQEGMPQLQTIKTAVHEIAHARCHDRDELAAASKTPPDQQTREVQAESVAYVVSSKLGLDTGDYSFGYISGWASGKDVPELKASMQQIRETASSIITDIEKELGAIEQERIASIQEYAAFVPEVGYLQLQRNAYEQWDYTLYSNEFTQVDGGVIENDIPANEALGNICAMHDLDPDSLCSIDPEDLADHLQQAEQSPYMRSMAKAAPKEVSLVKKTDTRLRPTTPKRDASKAERPPWEKEAAKPKQHEMDR